MQRTATRLVVVGAGASVVGLLLSGCVGTTPEPMPVPTYTSTVTPSASPTPERIPTFHPEGSAAANHQFFDYVNQAYWDRFGKGPGQDIVTNLTNNGFLKSEMEVTFDTTAINIPADSVIVSVRIQGECLIGQFGPTQYTSVLAPVLGTGRCLVGTTRPIDW
jgi:hypothetical protein